MKNYLIKFEYEIVRGRALNSTVYAKSEEDAYKIVTKHLQDEQKPLLTKWAIYKLLDGGEK